MREDVERVVGVRAAAWLDARAASVAAGAARARRAGRRLSWRRRRFVARRKGWVRACLCASFFAGAGAGQELPVWLDGTVLAGKGRLRGQVVVRPAVAGGAVRGASVRLVPAGPSGSVLSLLPALAGGPEPVAPVLDHAGRWSASGVVPTWRYAVIVEAEGCAPFVADTVGASWLASRRVDAWMASCWGEDRVAAIVGRPKGL